MSFDNSQLPALTAQIVAAFVSKTTVAASELPGLITSIHTTFTALSQGIAEPASTEPLVPAVPIKKSVTPDAITCLECGEKLKMLKRHLSSDHELTPEAYRERWKLPREYPMVAPNYTAQRSQLAKDIGLGKRGKD